MWGWVKGGHGRYGHEQDVVWVGTAHMMGWVMLGSPIVDDKRDMVGYLDDKLGVGVRVDRMVSQRARVPKMRG